MTTQNMPPASPLTLSDRARHLTRGLLAPPAKALHKWGVHPDFITVLGLGVVGIAAIAIVEGVLWLGGLILLIGMPLDALDGAVARLREAPRPFGAFFDSTLDRYADGLVFGALVLYGERNDSVTIMILALVALVGAFQVSYTRARAEGLDLECKIGLFSRFERVVVLLALLFTGWVHVGLWILALGTQFTGLQRILHVRRLTQSSEKV